MQGGVPLRTLPPLRVHHRHGGDMDDVLDVVAGLQHVDRRAQAEQDRPDRLRAAQPRQQLVGDVGRLQDGKTSTLASRTRLNG